MCGQGLEYFRLNLNLVFEAKHRPLHPVHFHQPIAFVKSKLDLASGAEALVQSLAHVWIGNPHSFWPIQILGLLNHGALVARQMIGVQGWLAVLRVRLMQVNAQNGFVSRKVTWLLSVIARGCHWRRSCEAKMAVHVPPPFDHARVTRFVTGANAIGGLVEGATTAMPGGIGGKVCAPASAISGASVMNALTAHRQDKIRMASVGFMVQKNNS
jgi:hypothetical protein